MSTATTVDAWTPQRPVFEPNGWQLDFRNQLRDAVRRLRPGPGQILDATYISAVDEAGVDAENVLLYCCLHR